MTTDSSSPNGRAFSSRLRRDITFADICRTADRFSSLLNVNDHKGFDDDNLGIARPKVTTGGLKWMKRSHKQGEPIMYKSVRFHYSGTGRNKFPSSSFPKDYDTESHVVYGADNNGLPMRFCPHRLHVWVKSNDTTEPWSLQELQALRKSMDECMGTRSTRITAEIAEDEEDEEDREHVVSTRAKGFPYELEIIRVCQGKDLMALVDELRTELFERGAQDPSSEPSFYHNRAILTDGFKRGKLYALRAIETDDMRERGASQEEIFVRDGSKYLLPCLCMTTSDRELTEIVWTHPRARRRGLASALLYDLRTTDPSDTIVPDSEGFWEYMDRIT